MMEFCASRWWLFLLRGAFAILFGIFAFIMPGLTLATLVLVWGAYAFADGAISLIGAILGRTGGDDRWIVGLQGLIGLIAGLIVMSMPGMTALGLLMVIAAFTLVVGVMQVFGAIRMRHEMEHAGWLALSGVASVVFALFVMANPGAGALALVWMIGLYSMGFGAVLVAFAFRLKGMGTRIAA